MTHIVLIKLGMVTLGNLHCMVALFVEALEQFVEACTDCNLHCVVVLWLQYPCILQLALYIMHSINVYVYCMHTNFMGLHFHELVDIHSSKRRKTFPTSKVLL